MSVRVMTAVWSLHLGDSEKIVLLALADCANDEGHCWPSMATLAKKCSKTDRTIQAAIKSLVDGGHLTRREVPGKGCNYTVHPRSDDTPEAASPPKPATPTPEAASDKPSRTINTTLRGARLPNDFAVPDDWIEWAMAERSWARADAKAEADAFCDYWQAKAGKDAARLDWHKTWRNWVRNSRRANGSGVRAASDRVTVPDQAAYLKSLESKPWANATPRAEAKPERAGKPITFGTLAAQIERRADGSP